jgi:hypothetical protein
VHAGASREDERRLRSGGRSPDPPDLPPELVGNHHSTLQRRRESLHRLLPDNGAIRLRRKAYKGGRAGFGRRQHARNAGKSRGDHLRSCVGRRQSSPLSERKLKNCLKDG